jgi:hypothetical protein
MSRDKNHIPIEVANFSCFFTLSVQVLIPSQGQELVLIAGMDKNITRLPIRYISKSKSDVVKTSIGSIMQDSFHIFNGTND